MSHDPINFLIIDSFGNFVSLNFIGKTIQQYEAKPKIVVVKIVAKIPFLNFDSIVRDYFNRIVTP